MPDNFPIMEDLKAYLQADSPLDHPELALIQASKSDPVRQSHRSTSIKNESTYH